MLLYIFFIIAGFLLLMKGADFLVDGSSSIAKKLNISTIIIGLTVVAIGTSMPELMVSLTASLNNHSDISIGNVIGSNLANLLLILGICAVIKPLKFEPKTERIDNFILLISTLLLFFFGNNNKTFIISRIEGLFLFVGALLFIFYNIVIAKKESKINVNNLETKLNLKNISIFESILAISLGIIALKLGGDLVVYYVSELASFLGLDEKLVSVTIISFSTSLPELITCITATTKGETDMAIGNILGSQILNVFLIIGISSIISPINYSPVYNIDMFFLFLGTVFFILFPFEGKKHHMTKSSGIIFLILYIIYIFYQVLKIGL